jgi:ketosteroid isomerase-like protein
MSTNTDLVRSVYEAFATGDVPSVLAALDPQIEWIEAEGFPTAGTYRGPEAVVSGVLGPLTTEWQGFSVVPNEFIDGGDTIVALGRYAGSFKGTGKAMSCDFAHVWTLRDGKAVRFRQYVDSALVQAAMRP